VITVLVFACIAAALLLLVTSFARSNDADEELSGEPMEPFVAPGQLADRIFSDKDYRCVHGLGAASLNDLLLRERRRLALTWLKRLKMEAAKVLSEHLHAVRADAQLRPATEIKLAFCAVQFYILYVALAAILRWRSTYRVGGILTQISQWSRRLSVLHWRLATVSGIVAEVVE
jgi:hypothetical protein